MPSHTEDHNIFDSLVSKNVNLFQKHPTDTPRNDASPSLVQLIGIPSHAKGEVGCKTQTLHLHWLPLLFSSHRHFPKWEPCKYNQVFVSACWEGWTNKLVLCSGRNLYWIGRILFKLVLKFLFGWSSFNLASWAPLVLCIIFQGACSQRGLSAVAGWKWTGPNLRPALRSGKLSAEQKVHNDLFVDFWKLLSAYLPTSLVLCHENSCHPFNFSICLNSANLWAQTPRKLHTKKLEPEEMAER